MKRRLNFSFLVVVLIYGLLVFGGWQWYHSAKSVSGWQFIEKHEVSNLVIQCMDHRFRLMENVWIKNNCGDDADILSWPGASKCLDPGNQTLKEDALEAVGKAIKDHNVKTIHLIHHLDCAGYGGSVIHADEQSERKFHQAEMVRAVRVLRERYPSIVVCTHLATPKEIEEIGP